MSEEARDVGSTGAPDAAGTGGALAAAAPPPHTAHHAQVTASEAPAPEGGKWTCEVCTYENFPLSRKCTMCRGPKPLLGEDIFRLQDGAAALPAAPPLPAADTCGNYTAPITVWPQCTMCRGPKPLLGEDIFRLQDGAAALPAEPPLPATDTCGNYTAPITVWPQCTMCRGPKPLLGEDIFRLQDGAAALPAEPPLPATDTCGNYTAPITVWPQCTMCRGPKPLLGEDIFRLQDGAAALPAEPPLPATDTCGVDAVAARLRPLRIASPPATAAGASAAPKWPCPTCTYENWPRSQKCAMCGCPAPPAPHANTTPAHNDNTHHNISEVNSQHASLGASKRRNNADWLWLQACLGVVEGSSSRVEAYLAAGGDPARALTPPEVQLLNRASAFDAGHTLVHLAIRFQRQDILSTLLSRISGGGPGLKRSPSYIAPDLATAIRRQLAGAVRHKKGSFPAAYLNECTTFALPAEIEELSPAIQEQLFSELLDRDAQQTLEGDPPLINWSLELTERLGSRMFALWNRSRGDCLPDALCQAAYGVFDRDNTLRAALADTLHHAHRTLYARWTAWERLQASLLQYAPEEAQLRAEWARLVAGAARPGTPLHQLHVFAFAHVMRRPVIVYGVNVVNSFRGEALGYAHFHGVYLPLLWEPEFCSKSPLCLGYTRGHFSALVPLQPATATGYIRRDDPPTVYLPLADPDGKLLPVHFLACDEMADEEEILRRWLVTCVTRGGVLAAKQTLPPPPLLVAQLLQEYLNHYRRLQQQTCAPFPPRLQAAAELSSDADTDDE